MDRIDQRSLNLSPEEKTVLEALTKASIDTPAYLVDRSRIRKNLELLLHIQKEANCSILLALKGFALHALFPEMRPYLSGIAASGIHEALLGYEYFKKEVHVYSPAYKEDEVERLLRVCDHMLFNSLSQWERFRHQIQESGQRVSCGLRVNPEQSDVSVDLYNPCAPCSRLGVLQADLKEKNLEGLEGLHFHALCEQNVDALERTLHAFEVKFGSWIPRMKWVNFGGGHHITRDDYDREGLVDLIQSFQKRYPEVRVYLEPGEAIALNAGYLIATVLDVVHNEMDIAILDTSATCHMPDVLEMPYRPDIIGADRVGEQAHLYRLAGPSCLAGDVIGDYSFRSPLKPGDRLIFKDMAHYTMVKNTTFNGVPLPSICLWDNTPNSIEVVQKFTYQDYKTRLS